MIKIERVETWGWEAAIRGMRNPLNSWEKSDSEIFVADFGENVCYRYDTRENFKSNDPYVDENFHYIAHVNGIGVGFSIGENDEKLMKTLIRGGPVECKFRRMIHVQMDITAPLYWWKEFDTYKVGTVANSCSTMHKIHAKEFTMEDFSTEHLYDKADLIDPKYRFDPEKDIALSAITVQGDRCYFTPTGLIQMTCDVLNRYREKFLETKDKRCWWQMIQLLPSSYNQKRTLDISYEVLANIYRHRKGHKLDEWRELCFEMSEILPYSWIFTEEFEGGAGWKEKDPDYKDILLRIAALVNKGKIKQEDVLAAVGFSFGVDLGQYSYNVGFHQDVDSQTIMNLKSQELEANAKQATNLKEEKKRLDPFTRDGEQQMLEEIRKEALKENNSKN